MKKQLVFKIVIFVCLVAMAILIGHFHPDKPLGEDHCPLCQLIAIGFTSLAQIIIRPTSYVISRVSSKVFISAPFFSEHHITLRAPPYHQAFSIAFQR